MVRVVLTALLLTSPALAGDQTVWWRTDGGTVTQDGKQCSLSILTPERALIFTWDKEVVTLNVQDESLNFKPETSVPIAVQLGDTWLGNSDVPFLLATGRNDYMSLALTQAMLDPALADVDHVTVKLTNKVMRFDFSHTKMPALLKATNECRKHIH